VRVALHSVGCRLNAGETEALASILQARGYLLVPSGDAADVCIINTCTVTAAGDADSRRAIRRARRRSPAATVVATGCYAQRRPAAVRAAGADLVVGNRDKARLVDLLEAFLAGRRGAQLRRSRAGSARFLQIQGPVPGGRTRGLVQIQDGCDQHCSYCIVPSVRGRSVSRPPAEILAQAARMVEMGYRELALTGVQVGSYGRDWGHPEALLELLAQLERIDGLERIRLGSVAPGFVTDALIERVARSARICHHLHVPLQSGADAVLRDMGRRYTAAEYGTLVARIAAAMPDCAIGADVLVGFPTEGDAEFERTFDLIAGLPLAYLHVFAYSPRTGTPAARLRVAAGPAVLRERVRRLLQLGAAKRLTFHQRHLGQVLEVLVEGRAKSSGGMCTGMSGNYIRTFFAGPAPPNRVVGVRVTSARTEAVEGCVEAWNAGAEPASRPAECQGRVCGCRREGGRSVYIETYGCQMNLADSELVARILHEAGYALTDRPEDADVILLNTCAVRAHAEDRALGRAAQLGGLRAQRPWLTIGILGCVAQRLGAALPGRTPSVDLVVGPDGYRRLPALLARPREQGLVDVRRDRREAYADLVPLRRTRTNAWVTVSRGCDRFCAFCIVPFVRGRQRCVPPDEVLRQVEEAAARGYREITLLGQTVSSYVFGDTAFAGLLRRVARVPGVARVRFVSPYPADFTPELVEVMASEPAVCAALHLPVQSGSDAQLALMGRGYDVAQYRRLVQQLRQAMPGIVLTTDVMAGFCGETAADFAATLDLLETVRFDAAFMFRYSPRPGTRACTRLRDDVPEEVKIARLERIIATQERISAEINQGHVGAEFEVLVEGPSRRGVGSEQRYFGRTEGGKVVVFQDAAPANSLVRVRINGATSHTLFGELVGGPRA